jgi:hypothetical protein
MRTQGGDQDTTVCLQLLMKNVGLRGAHKLRDPSPILHAVAEKKIIYTYLDIENLRSAWIAYPSRLRGGTVNKDPRL